MMFDILGRGDIIVGKLRGGTQKETTAGLKDVPPNDGRTTAMINNDNAIDNADKDKGLNQEHETRKVNSMQPTCSIIENIYLQNWAIFEGFSVSQYMF